VAPAASLTIEKQRRLCVSGGHHSCATYGAAVDARNARIPSVERFSTGWGWVRTTPVVEGRLGLGASVAALLGDRRRWQVVPALVLVVALLALGFSNLGRGGPATTAAPTEPAVASVAVQPTPGTPVPATPAPSPLATQSPPATEPPPSPSAPSSPSPAPTPRATASPTARPTQAAGTTYVVKSGDSLYAIAGRFGTTVNAIKTLNGLTSNTLRVGQKLLIP
jgi:LysM repeat protein